MDKEQLFAALKGYYRITDDTDTQALIEKLEADGTVTLINPSDSSYNYMVSANRDISFAYKPFEITFSKSETFNAGTIDIWRNLCIMSGLAESAANEKKNE